MLTFHLLSSRLPVRQGMEEGAGEQGTPHPPMLDRALGPACPAEPVAGRAGEGRPTCKTTSTGIRTAGEPQRVRTKRTVLQTRRQMKMSGMRTSFLSATEVWRWSWCTSETMGRYSESSSRCAGKAEIKTHKRNLFPSSYPG